MNPIKLLITYIRIRKQTRQYIKATLQHSGLTELDDVTRNNIKNFEKKLIKMNLCLAEMSNYTLSAKIMDSVYSAVDSWIAERTARKQYYDNLAQWGYRF